MHARLYWKSKNEIYVKVSIVGHRMSSWYQVGHMDLK